MITQKLDFNFLFKLQKKAQDANFELERVRRVREATAKAPPSPELASKTDELAKKVKTLIAAATSRADTNVRKYPNARVTLTNAAHVFSESISINLDNERKVRDIYSSQIIVLISR